MMSRSSRQLSDGERFRLRLALAYARVQQQPSPGPTLLLVDEFASVLDRTTARCLCSALRRWLAGFTAGPAPTAVLATAHDDVRAWLTPDLTVEFSRDGAARTLEQP